MWDIWRRAAFLCSDYGLIASTQSEWLQGLFYDLTGMFYRVGLRENMRKSVRMICQPCLYIGEIGRGICKTYNGVGADLLGPPESVSLVPVLCGVEYLAVVFLASHRHTQHVVRQSSK